MKRSSNFSTAFFIGVALSIFQQSCGKPEVLDPGPLEPEIDVLKTKDRTIHNTKYCQVNDNRQIITEDFTKVHDEGGGYRGRGGGCISRPIRDVWGVVLNHSLMKDDDLDRYNAVRLPDLENPSEKLFFAFDITSHVTKIGVGVEWVSRWFHTVTAGDLKKPHQISIRFQKTSGLGKLKVDREEYILDRVTPKITSFVMDQTIEAPQVDADRVRKNIEGILRRLRSGQPNSELLNSR